jgi:hypothetical protein
MSREMLSKKAFENWYFEYSEAEREFLEAKRNFDVKIRDICLFLFKAYACWCKEKYGKVLRPESHLEDDTFGRPVEVFFSEFDVGSAFRELSLRLLNQAYDDSAE